MERLAELLKELILIDSSTKAGANKAIEYCNQWLKEQALPAELLENNGYRMIVCEIGEGDKTVVLNGHVDVVSGHEEQFVPVEEDGRLYARGAADMKAGVAAMMYTAAKLKDEPLGVKLQLQIVSDEEIGGFNCSGYLVENGYTGDFVICAEPTTLGIALQAKGSLRLDIEVAGKPAHGSRPWEGVNAIEKAYEVYGEILKLPFTRVSSEFYKAPSVNLAKINGGDAYNKVPETCTLFFDIRYLPGQTADEIIQQIEDAADGKVLVNMVGRPVETKREDPFVQALQPVVEKHISKEAVFFGQHGAADTSFFSKKGIPAIEFGPSGINWHGNEENVFLDSLYTYKDILIDFIKNFDSK